MEHTKLTSIRLELDTIKEIEEIVENERWYKQSSVINNILAAVFQNFTKEEIRNMVYRFKWHQNVVDAKFEPTKELKTPKRG